MSGGVIARLLDVLAKPGARILQPAVKPRVQTHFLAAGVERGRCDEEGRAVSGSASSRDLTPDERELAEALRISKATAKARVGIWEREQWSIGFDEGARAMRNLLALAGRPDEEQPRITDTMVEAAWTVLNGEPVEPEWEEAFVKKASLRAALEAALGAVASPLPADAREIVEAMAEAPMTKWSVHWITKARELLGMEPRYVTVDSPPVAGPADQGGRP